MTGLQIKMIEPQFKIKGRQIKTKGVQIKTSVPYLKPKGNERPDLITRRASFQ